MFLHKRTIFFIRRRALKELFSSVSDTLIIPSHRRFALIETASRSFLRTPDNPGEYRAYWKLIRQTDHLYFSRRCAKPRIAYFSALPSFWTCPHFHSLPTWRAVLRTDLPAFLSSLLRSPRSYRARTAAQITSGSLTSSSSAISCHLDRDWTM